MPGRRHWGVLGTAGITADFLRGLGRSDGGSAVAIASRDPARGRTFADAHAIPNVLPSYEALITSEDVDFVYVPLPNSLHCEWTVRALEAGKHVLCEKPLATCAAEAIKVADAAARADRYVMEGFMYRHHPQWAALRRILDEGRLGELVRIDSWFGFPLDPTETTPGSAALGGGALLDVGCYCVHLTRMVTGAEPLRVNAMRRGDLVDTSMVGTMQMPAGQIATFDCSIEQDERRGARLTGTRATAIVERPWLPGDDPAPIRIERDGVIVDRILTPAADNHRLQIEAFVQAAEGAGAPHPIADSVANAHVIDALFTSAREGRTTPVSGQPAA